MTTIAAADQGFGDGQGTAIWANPATRQVLDSMSELFMAFDRHLNVVFVNHAFLEVIQDIIGNPVGRNHADVWPELRDSVVETSYRRALATGVPVQFQFLLSGAGRWIDTNAVPSGDFLCVYFRDITVQKELEAERERDRTLLRDLVDAIPHIAWVAELDGQILAINGRWREYTGSAGTSVQEVTECVHPDDLVTIRQSMQERDTAAPCEYDIRLRRHDGEYRWHNVKVAPIASDAGTTLRWIGTSTDVHERRAVEEALRKAEATSRMILEGLPDAVLVLSMDGRVVGTNPAWQSQHGSDQPDFAAIATQFECRDLEGRRVPVDEWPAARALRGERVSGELLEVLHRETGRRFFANYSALPVTANGESLLVVSAHDVTDLVEAQRDLRDARQRLDATLSAGEIATWTWDLTSDRVRADVNLQRIFDVTPEEARGAPISAYVRAIHPDDRERVIRTINQAVAGSDRYEAEYRVRGADGRERWTVTRGLVERDAQGKAIYLPGVLIDITARKKAEEALAQNEEHFRLLVESVPEMAWTARPDGIIDYYNERWYEYTGFDRSMVGEASWASILHPDEFKATVDAWNDAIRGGQPYEAEVRFRDRFRGGYRWFLTRARPLRNEQGEIVRWFGMTMDVHEQKATAEALAAANRVGAQLAADLDLDRIVQALTDASTEVTGAEFGAFFYNVVDDAGESYMLYTISGVPREMFSQFPMPRNTPVFGPTFAGEGIVRSDDITKDPRYGTMDTYGGMPKGHLPVRSYLAIPVVSRSGEVLGGLFFGHSKTGVFSEEHERLVLSFASQAAVALDNARLYSRVSGMNEELERRVAERTAELKAANAEMEGFTYTVAHDLRAPLRAIMSTASVVREEAGEALNEHHRYLLDRQAFNAKYLAQLIDDLLTYARLGRQEVQRQPVDLSDLAERAASAMRETFTGTIEIQPGMTVDADPKLIRLVLDNLIGNACKFSPAGGTVRIGEADGRFFVSDEGVGFSMAHAPKLFQPFERLVRQEEFPGTGIGLANVKRIIDRHGGEIQAQSTPGQGTTFTFTLK